LAASRRFAGTNDDRAYMSRLGKITSVFVAIRRELERAVSRIVGQADIDDIVQETFLRSFEADLQQEIRYPRAFMLKTARNLALNHVDRSEQRLVDSTEETLGWDALEQTASVEAQVDSQERFRNFCRAVSELPLQCRRAFILKKVYGLSQQEISRYLGISESTVEKHIAKGMLGCWSYLEARGMARRSTPAGSSKAKAARRDHG